MFAGYRHCKKCGKILTGLFDGALCDDCEKKENEQKIINENNKYEIVTEKGVTDKL